MPSLEEHCQRSLQRYGVEGRDIHQWLDQPSRKYATGHREFRHDTETIKLVGELFGKEYGKSLAENIALDHIMLDHEEEIRQRSSIVLAFPEREIPSIPCPYCKTLLKSTDQSCPHCGASRTRIVEEFDRAYEKEKIELQEKRKQLRRELKLERRFKEMSLEDRIPYWEGLEGLYTLGRGDSEEYEVMSRVMKEEFERNPELKKELERRAVSRKKFTTCLLLFVMGTTLVFAIGGWNYVSPRTQEEIGGACGLALIGAIVGFFLSFLFSFFVASLKDGAEKRRIKKFARRG